MLETNASEYIPLFMENNKTFLEKLHNSVSDNKGSLSLFAFKKELEIELIKAHSLFYSKPRDNNFKDKYLYGAAHIFAKKKENLDKISRLICPACHYLGNARPVAYRDKLLSCDLCFAKLQKLTFSDPDYKLYKSFCNYTVDGYKCNDCNRFVPRSSCQEAVNCPYSDCGASNLLSGANKMYNPRLNFNWRGFSTIDINSDWQIKEKHKFYEENINKLKENQEYFAKKAIECIEEQIKTLHFKCFPSTYKVNLAMYEAFISCIDSNPEEYVSYFCSPLKRSGSPKLQSRIFDQFIEKLESKLPYSFIKGGKTFEVKSLLSENLSIFDGESRFVSSVNSKGYVDNTTEELYIGGRGAHYLQPYSIGKLISVINIETKENLMKSVSGYDRNKVYLTNVPVGTQIEIKHLRISPHPYMGAFVYLNRLKKHLAERIQIKIKS